MTAKKSAIENMREAFTVWEEEYRANPDTFMDDAAKRAKTPGDIGELCAIYFAELCDRVRARKANKQR